MKHIAKLWPQNRLVPYDCNLDGERLGIMPKEDERSISEFPGNKFANVRHLREYYAALYDSLILKK